MRVTGGFRPAVTPHFEIERGFHEEKMMKKIAVSIDKIAVRVYRYDELAMGAGDDRQIGV